MCVNTIAIALMRVFRGILLNNQFYRVCNFHKSSRLSEIHEFPPRKYHLYSIGTLLTFNIQMNSTAWSLVTHRQTQTDYRTLAHAQRNN